MAPTTVDHRTCSVDDCDRKHSARGYCGMHYQRLLKHGDPLTRKKVYATGSDDERFDHYVDKSHPDGCHVWTGYLNHDGYGRFSVSGKLTMTHRYAWERVHGPIPQGHQMNHQCHNRACCNPDHLKLSTQAENIAEMMALGRAARGETRGNSKLTESDVREIRRLDCFMPRKQIAARFGIGVDNVCRIANRKRWRHVV